ncbi:MAG: hypothetical protein VX265_18495 [Myxococcota bacterium]|nr:hypothetical protein [Myxococcota bacterium]MEC8424524.1 hypothetical protein [Myxococcota bacterium]
MSEPRDEDAEQREPHREGRGPRLRGFARRILGEGDDGRDPQGEEREHERREARAMLHSLLETGDKARMEIVRLLAREMRSYLEALELHKDIHHLLTNYSLEVNASFHLKPLPEEQKEAATAPGVRVGLRPKPDGAEAAEPPEPDQD